MACTVLPQELIDTIIDALEDIPDSDMQDLNRCCMVARDWVPRSRVHVFGQCTLTRSNQIAFKELLLSPLCTFSSAVRSITLRDHASDAAVLFPIVCSLPLIQHIGIRTFSSSYTSPTDTPLRPPASLHSLSVTHSARMSPILTWLYRTDHFQYIDALTLLRIRQPDIPMVRRALQGTAASLEHLILSISPEMFLDELPVQLLDHDFDLSAHTQLKSLVLHNVVVDFLGPWFKGEPLYLHSVIPIILRMTSPNLERVTINLHGYREREHYRWLNWAQLDTFLGSRTRFPCLDSVVFGVYFEYGYLSSQLRATLPGLNAAGLLKLVDHTTYHGY